MLKSFTYKKQQQHVTFKMHFKFEGTKKKNSKHNKNKFEYKSKKNNKAP